MQGRNFGRSLYWEAILASLSEPASIVKSSQQVFIRYQQKA